MKKTFELYSSLFGSLLVSFTLIKFVRGDASQNEYKVTRIVDEHLNPITSTTTMAMPELLDLIESAIDEYIEAWYDEENRKPLNLTDMLVMQRDSDHVSRVVVHDEPEDEPKQWPASENAAINPHKPYGYTTDQWADAEIALCAASTRRGFIY